MWTANRRTPFRIGTAVCVLTAKLGAQTSTAEPVACPEQQGQQVLYVQVTGAAGRVLSRDPDRAVVEYLDPEKHYVEGTAATSCFTIPLTPGHDRVKVRARATLYLGAERDVASADHTKPDRPYRLALLPKVPAAFDAVGDAIPLTKLTPKDRKRVVLAVVDTLSKEPETTRKQGLDDAAAVLQTRPELLARSYLTATIRPDCTADCVTPEALATKPPFVRDWLLDKREAIGAEDRREHVLQSLAGAPKTPTNTLATAILADGTSTTRLPDSSAGGDWTKLTDKLAGKKDSPFAQYDDKTLKAALGILRKQYDAL